MTFISEAQIYVMSTIRGEGVEERFEVLLRSYFHSWDTDYISRSKTSTGTQILFKRTDFSLVLSVPVISFQTPQYARVLVQRQLDIAERERQQRQETVVAEGVA